MKQPEIKEQINLAIELGKYMATIQQRLETLKNEYKKKCATLREAGMLEEEINDFEQNCMEETVESITKIIRIIEEQHKPKVKNYIYKLNDLLPKNAR